MVKIKRALISVSDKSGILDFARELDKFGVEILSTGGTAKLLRENNIAVRGVSDYTGFPEMLDGRVKTLHPKIHAGLLALRDNPEHMAKLKEHAIGLIDMVVVNLYPFEKTTQKPAVGIEEVIENIDIGGPSMLRSAAKNAQSVAVVSNPARYPEIIKELKANAGSLSEDLLRRLSIEVFALTGHYDSVIYNYLKNYFNKKSDSQDGFPQDLSFSLNKIQDLRYGENPHQRGAFYREKGKEQGLINVKQLQGKELSFNNILDLNSTVELVKEFKNPAAVITKHNNPCGAAEGKNLAKAYLDALACDSLSAFGSIVAFNRKLDLACAKAILNKGGFVECIIAPSIDEEAKELFKRKKNLRLLELEDMQVIDEYEVKRISGGFLVQDKDLKTVYVDNLRVLTKKKPTKKELASLIFGWKVAKHVKSNAIVLTKGTATVGIGAGQMSRVDAVIIAKRKAGKKSRNSCMASDAFFPKPDAIVQAHKAGVKAIIQPGGSISDPEVIRMCDKYRISMVATGLRHFKH
ncbi:MAG: bifunctional phosphoribosylaminoimidazolecarboxamide formyltransferase/inosine monophosphate cyclohydrolase [Candidatus Omnitrophota bacterium]|nr:MAG: bifunctional phosphoribosylaminoimidazolecarboxamide formyltransferase/inosine monophosphate cyclohydrolase [Candidatus Omnitrophota bacterium]